MFSVTLSIILAKVVYTFYPWRGFLFLLDICSVGGRLKFTYIYVTSSGTCYRDTVRSVSD